LTPLQSYPLPPLEPKPGPVGDLCRQVLSGVLSALPPLLDALRDDGRGDDARRVETVLANRYLYRRGRPQSLYPGDATSKWSLFCRDLAEVLLFDLFETATVVADFNRLLTETKDVDGYDGEPATEEAEVWPTPPATVAAVADTATPWPTFDADLVAPWPTFDADLVKAFAETETPRRGNLLLGPDVGLTVVRDRLPLELVQEQLTALTAAVEALGGRVSSETQTGGDDSAE
jgi:hypothetical protein